MVHFMDVELTRTIRFCLDASGHLADDAPAANTFAAWPPMRGLGRYYQLIVTCRGQVHEPTGYLVNIKHIDTIVRQRGLPAVAEFARHDDAPLGRVLRAVWAAIEPELECEPVSVTLQLTPHHTVALKENDMNRVLITQQFDFSAAHRLHVPDLSDEQNREIFGKCNNPSGHGHNYRFELAVHAPIKPDGRITAVEQLDQLVDRVVLERFDHKHLNVDVPEFDGLNPSVEHIAKVIYELLQDEVKALGVTLESVKVWETEKTACTYRGE
jgi:6-pyruvoyltetrahydropterin/6-carboxytetrahydropterin synthase